MTGGAAGSAQPSGAGLNLDGTVARGDFVLRLGLDVAPGEVVGVIGPNGAGKTTLLRALAGLEPLAAGRLALDGQVMDDPAHGRFVRPEQRRIGLVFQNYRLFPSMDVRDNVGFAARSRGAGRARSREIADTWLARLEIAGLADRRPAELSGGQAQRVALARALAADPALLLLDEPLAALDAQTKAGIRAELRRHLGEFAGATVLITHDPLEAMVLTDRLVVIEDGRLVQQGTPVEVARRPGTHYVAQLVGLNLYQGESDAHGLVSLAAGGTFATAPADPVAAGPVLVALRPSAIALHRTQPQAGSPRNVWPGTVAGLELLSDRVRAQVDGAPGSPDAMVDLTPEAVGELGLAVGSPVWLSAKATEFDVYPA